MRAFLRGKAGRLGLFRQREDKQNRAILREGKARRLWLFRRRGD
jgi:hypothetical protein